MAIGSAIRFTGTLGKFTWRMLATVLLVWCVGSFLVAPVVGRAIRQGRVAQGEGVLAHDVPSPQRSLEVA